MIDILSFVFQSFWHFIGFMILLSISVGGIVGFVGAFFPDNVHNHYYGNNCECKDND